MGSKQTVEETQHIRDNGHENERQVGLEQDNVIVDEWGEIMHGEDINGINNGSGGDTKIASGTSGDNKDEMATLDSSKDIVFTGRFQLGRGCIR